jgi:hypothetical protein
MQICIKIQVRSAGGLATALSSQLNVARCADGQWLRCSLYTRHTADAPHRKKATFDGSVLSGSISSSSRESGFLSRGIEDGLGVGGLDGGGDVSNMVREEAKGRKLRRGTRGPRRTAWLSVAPGRRAWRARSRRWRMVMNVAARAPLGTSVVSATSSEMPTPCGCELACPFPLGQAIKQAKKSKQQIT